jgi:hypothetical protein
MITKSRALKEPRNPGKSTHTWHLVTNHQNMLYMLAAGIAMGPAGFRGKYYLDSLGVYPGWVPFFRPGKKIPRDALDQATCERKHLLPCVASFNLSKLSSPVQILSRDGRMRDVASPSARKGKNDIAILIRAPLPLTLLSKINFRSPEDRQAFEHAAQDVSNVDLSSSQIEVSESLFSTTADIAWPPERLQGQLFEAASDNLPALGLAQGGVLAMLYHTANRSDLGLAAFKLATKTEHDKDDNLSIDDPILKELPNWLNSGQNSNQGDIGAQLFWGVIRSLIDEQMKDQPPPPVEVALAYLESQLAELSEDKFRTYLERLIADMRDCFGLGGGTITEQFERHKGPLSRSLLLFCLREHCTDLLEFSHDLLSDAEYVLASILFGVRDGWLQLPHELRNPDLSAYVSGRMAYTEHRKRGDEFRVDEPSCPIPLRDFFNGAWNEMKKSVALELAHKCHWNDCIQTRITLAESDGPEEFKRNGSQVLLPGEVTAVTEVVKGNFLHRLGSWPPIDSDLESELRNRLTRGKD